MQLTDQISRDITLAMKSKDSPKLMSLRNLKSAITNEQKSGGAKDDKEVIKLIEKLVKQREISEQIYRKEERFDLANVEAYEINVYLGYIPAFTLASETEIDEIVLSAEQHIIRGNGELNMKHMKGFMTMVQQDLETKGLKADMATIAYKVKESIKFYA